MMKKKKWRWWSDQALLLAWNKRRLSKERRSEQITVDGVKKLRPKQRHRSEGEGVTDHCYCQEEAADQYLLNHVVGVKRKRQTTGVGVERKEWQMTDMCVIRERIIFIAHRKQCTIIDDIVWRRRSIRVLGMGRRLEYEIRGDEFDSLSWKTIPKRKVQTTAVDVEKY
jgi:hypothetical protein